MASGRAKRLADLFHKFWSIRPAQGPIVSRHKALIRIHSDTEKGMAAIWSVEYTTRRSVVRCSWNAANIPPWCFFPWFHGSFTFAFYVIKTETFLQRRLASGKDINGNTETKRRCFHAVRLLCSCCRPCFRVPVFLAEAILLQWTFPLETNVFLKLEAWYRRMCFYMWTILAKLLVSSKLWKIIWWKRW